MHKCRPIFPVKSLLIATAGWTVCGGAAAAELTGSAAVAPGFIFTDNVCLEKNNKQSDWVATATPSGAIAAKGNKASFNMSGSVQFNSLTDSQLESNDCAGGTLGNRKQFAPNINARGKADLIDNWLSISGFGRANQNEVSSFRTGGNDPLDRNGNTNTYYRYSVSPLLSRRLKDDVARVSLRYTYDEIINTEDTVNDSTSNRAIASIKNGGESQISWNLMGQYRKVEYDDENFVGTNQRPRQDTELKSASLSLGYQIDRSWQINGRYGKEWNDFQSYNNSDTGGNAWDIGVRWTPSPRTTVAVGMTDRFFGKTPRVSIAHTYRRHVFTGSYNKQITFGRDIRTSSDLLNPGYVNNSAVNDEGPILDERLSAGYTYNGRYAVLNLSGYHSEQTREDDGEQSTFQNWAVSVSPLISRTYTFSGTLAWNKDEPRGIAGIPNSDFSNTSESWITNLTVGRALNNRMNLSVSYQYTDQQSDDSFNEYKENRITATLNISL